MTTELQNFELNQNSFERKTSYKDIDSGLLKFKTVEMNKAMDLIPKKAKPKKKTLKSTKHCINKFINNL